MRDTSLGRRRFGVGLAPALAVILVMTFAAPAGAATVGESWRAKIGSAGMNGTATIQAYTTGSGSLALKLAGMRPATYLPVTLSKGTCASVGSTLITFPAIRTTSTGAAARTSSLTVAQVAKLKAATAGTGKIAIRVGRSTTGGIKCGVFALLYVPIGIVVPSGWLPEEGARFEDALKASGYGVQVLSSQDSATEAADVRALIGRGIRVLILTPQAGAAAAAAADRARAAGISVIANDRLVLDTVAVDYYVTFDNLAIGAAQAQYLIDRAGATKGNDLYLYAGNPADNNSFVFLEGAWEKLQPGIADGTFVIRNSSLAVALQGNPTLTRDQQSRIIGQITTNWDVNTARYLAQSNLMAAAPADKGTVFILAPNDATARAIATAFAADPAVTKAYLTGQDADRASIQAIIDGRQGMTVFKDPRLRVNAAVAAALAFLKGGTPVATTSFSNGAIDVPAQTSAIVTVTRDNVQAALIDPGYFKAGDFSGTWPGKP